MSTPTTADRTLAATVASRLDTRPHDRCAAWIESADRVCGKPSAAHPWLCARHATVAKRRLAKAAAEDEARADRYRAEQERMRPAREARLAAVEARLRQIDPIRRDGLAVDRAAQHAPLAQRLPSDARIEELARLHKRAAGLRRDLGLS
ncbi:hypothetical protein M3G50_07545 [Brachybacterium muris]|uniref:hypothetical protein n=1 Tax=Brachybacterium muris TaxID=219301 RepID=UPI0021A76E70|nr:hypothetical protein [Brachybacterium muris]MCT1430606.1 hypothetical protein [Brachybacterium muris]